MNVEKIREMYPEGTQIILQEMRGESQMPYGLKGTVKFVDDAGQIHMRWENGSSLALNIDEDTFEKVETSEKISVILIEPGRYPKLIEIEDTLEAMQETVGGYIEEYMPFDDEVAIICNEEGKMNGAELNRAIYSEPENVEMTINVRGTVDAAYDFARYNIAYYDNAAICHAFCLMPEEIAEILHPSAEGLTEGKICMRLKLTNGTYSYEDNCGGELGGFWCNAIGEPQGWGENARTYTKLHTIYDMEVGFMPGALTAGESYPQVVELVYTKDGKEYIATLKFNFIIE